MYFFSVATSLAFWATATLAVPSPQEYASGDGFQLGPETTVQDVSKKCGDAQISCCNRQTNNIGNAEAADQGLLNGVLGDLINSGAGSSLGLFEQCSKLTANGKRLTTHGNTSEPWLIFSPS